MASATLYLTYISTKYYSIIVNKEEERKQTSIEKNIEEQKIEVKKITTFIN